MRDMSDIMRRIVRDGFSLIIAGDLNIDRHAQNDLLSRPELKALTPILEDLMLTENISQLNFKPTRHQTGCKSSLLDLYLSTIPERIKNVENVMNTLSGHEGIRCVVQLKGDFRKANSFALRKFTNCTFNVMQPMVDESVKLQGC